MNRYAIPSSSSAKHQQGAVLIVSLVILIGMTLIGVASMGTSLVQEKMATNAQTSNVSFQAAESAVRGLIRNVLSGEQTVLSNAMGTQQGESGPVIEFELGDQTVDSSYQVTYMGVVALTSGGSLDADESATTLQAHRFDIAATGVVNSTNAQTLIRQGIEYH